MYIFDPVLILLISFLLHVGRDDSGEIQKSYASLFVFFGNSIISYFLFENLKQYMSDFKTCSRILIPPLSLRRGTPIFFARSVLLLRCSPLIEAATTFIAILVSSVLVRLVASINVFALVKIFSADYTVSDSLGSINIIFFFYL